MCVKRVPFLDKLIIFTVLHNPLSVWFQWNKHFKWFKDTHREKAMSNKTPALAKGMNMDIWVVGTSNQFFIRDS